MNANEKVYGYINLGAKRFAFAIDGFIGRIFDGVIGFRFSEKIKLPSVLYGVTDKNYDIAIKITNSNRMSNCIMFGIGYYAIGAANLIHYDLSKFNRIEFVGGTGNCILDPTLIYPRYDWEDNIYENGCSIKFKPIKEVDKKYSITVQKTSLVFQSTINPYQDRKDNYLGSTNSAILLRFDALQPFDSIWKWYNYVSKIAALLVQQQNIAFDKIKISSGDSSHREQANVFLNYGYEDVVNKKPIRTISLRTFDRVFSNFSQMIDSEDFSINFLPDNNTDARFVSYETIKNLCTAVEYEFSKSEVKKEKNPIINNLVKEVKKVLKKYKASTPELTEKAYQSISSSISKWNLPATEQFNLLYCANKTTIDKLTNHQCLVLTEEAINNFVKCRNDITHGSRPALDSSIADTAYCIKVLIYVSLFKRIGLTDEETYHSLEMVF